MLNEIDPYQDILELKQFAMRVDEHLNKLIHNQKEFITAINETSDKVKQLQERLQLLEVVLNEIAIEKRT